MSGSMPDSVMGMAVDSRLLNSKTVIWKYGPRDIHKPGLDLYVMYESMSGRVSLEIPEDVFRLKNNIEFINTSSGKLDPDKSLMFRQAMDKAGFTFPAQYVWGNPNPKKPYDEGYFILDNNRELFHMKMVNGRPYVRNTKIADKIDIAFFSMKEVADKSIYGFVISKNGEIYTVNAEGYGLTKFDIPPINIDQDAVMLMSNLFYWMVNVTTDVGCTYNVLNAVSLEQHTSPYFVGSELNKWDKISTWVFPAYIKLWDKNSMYVKPDFVINFGKAFLISGVLALLFIFTIGRKRNTVRRITDGVLIFILGIPALIASLIIK